MGINTPEVNVLGSLWSGAAINVFTVFPFSRLFLQPQGLETSENANWRFGYNLMVAKHEAWGAFLFV